MTATTARARLDRPNSLELRFGDPLDPENPLGYQAFLTADERGELLPAGTAALDAERVGSWFVPRSLGGQLVGLDALGAQLRSVFRRDAALGLGHAAISLIAAAPVWTAGDLRQRRWLADTLLANGSVACAYTELGSGNDLLRSQVTARPHGQELLLRGRKEVIANIVRAHAATVLARTSDEPGSRSHSVLLLDLRTAPRERLHFLPRYRTAGMRAVNLGGVDFRDCPVPAGAVVGEPGSALETVLRAFQVTKAVLTSATVGALDTQLRTVTTFALQRRLYGRSVTELPHARSILAGAFVDLLVCDALASTACRALHVLPGQTSVYAPASKYLVPLLTQEAVDALAVVLGARSFLREGQHAVFQKHLRDLPLASLAHSSATICQATIIPQLSRLARRSWLSGGGAPDAVFRLSDPLAELDFCALQLSAGAHDPLIGELLRAEKDLAGDRDLGAACTLLVTQLRSLADACVALAPRNRTPLADPVSFELAERYCLLLAASACLGVWRVGREQADPFLREPTWLVAALRRLTTRLGHDPHPGGDDVEQAIVEELVARTLGHRALDLPGRPVC